jgi:sulfatase modifying factor 1
MTFVIAIAAFLATCLAAHSEHSASIARAQPRQGMVKIPASEFQATFVVDATTDRRQKEQKTKVDAFWLDEAPVTNQAYLRFVGRHPEWRRDRVASLFADEHYLSHWKSPTVLGTQAGSAEPVRFVSWFAATAYCEARGGRLPTWNEWELVSIASESARDARRDPAWQQRILGWYATPNAARPSEIRRGRPNVYGLYDMHGLLWEWVEDFNSLLVSGDSREGGARDNRFCGGGATAAREKGSYSMFMHTAFLSSLQARYAVANLGFRCARSAAPDVRVPRLSTDPKGESK